MASGKRNSRFTIACAVMIALGSIGMMWKCSQPAKASEFSRRYFTHVSVSDHFVAAVDNYGHAWLMTTGTFGDGRWQRLPDPSQGE